LGTGGLGKPLGGDHEHSLRGHEALEAGGGVFQQASFTGQGQHLFGHGGPAGRPETRAGSTGHHHGMEHSEILCNSGETATGRLALSRVEPHGTGPPDFPGGCFA